MNIADVEKILLTNMTPQYTLEDLFLMSPGSSELTNLVLAKLLNQRHHLHVASNKFVCCPLRNNLAA